MKSSAPIYDWRCLCCDRATAAGTSVCAHCQMPLGQSTKDIEAARLAWLKRNARAEGLDVPAPSLRRFDDVVVNYKKILYRVCAGSFLAAIGAALFFFVLLMDSKDVKTGTDLCWGNK